MPPVADLEAAGDQKRARLRQGRGDRQAFALHVPVA